MTGAIVQEAGKVGFKFNTRKTEKNEEDTNQVEIEGEALQEVEKFVYLGCEMREDGDTRYEVGIRIGKVEAAFRNLEKI